MEHWNPPADSPLAGIDPAAASTHSNSGLAPATAPEPAQSTALVPIRHDGWTAPKQAKFLRVFAATGNVSLAAREVGMTRQSAYKLRARLKGEPFDHAWEAAFGTGYDRLAEAALERAINGTEVPHYHQGELVGTHRRYDERLALGLLAHRPGAPARRQPLPRVALDCVGDLGLMSDRVAHGPESWAEEAHDIAAAQEIARRAQQEAWDLEEEEAEAAMTEDERRLAAIPIPDQWKFKMDQWHEGFREGVAALQGWGPSAHMGRSDDDEDDDEDDDDEDDDERAEAAFWEKYDPDGDSDDGGNGGANETGANAAQSVNRARDPKNPAGPRISGL